MSFGDHQNEDEEIYKDEELEEHKGLGGRHMSAALAADSELGKLRVKSYSSAAGKRPPAAAHDLSESNENNQRMDKYSTSSMAPNKRSMPSGSNKA
jgi:hypothetical protein